MLTKVITLVQGRRPENSGRTKACALHADEQGRNSGFVSGIEQIEPMRNILRRVLGREQIKGEGDRNADWNFEQYSVAGGGKPTHADQQRA
jgi:hypothetical protein